MHTSLDVFTTVATELSNDQAGLASAGSMVVILIIGPYFPPFDPGVAA